MKFSDLYKVLISFVVLLVASELLLRAAWFQKNSETPIAISRAAEFLSYKIFKLENQKVTGMKALLMPDNLLGTVYKPGAKGKVTKKSRFPFRKGIEFLVTIDADGNRISGNKPAQSSNEIWFFGDSFTWGWGVNDWETYPYLIQSGLTDVTVRNFSVSGYGNYWQMLRFRKVLEKPAKYEKKNIAAVFVYNNFHLRRNIKRFVRLAKKVDKGILTESNALPAGRIDEDCNRRLAKSITRASALQSKGLPKDIGEFPFTEILPIYSALDCMVGAAKRIFSLIYKTAIQNNIKPVFIYHTASPDDPIVEFVRSLGFLVVDLWVDPRNKSMTLAPIDGHPNAAAHRFYADSFLKQARPFLSEWRKRTKQP